MNPDKEEFVSEYKTLYQGVICEKLINDCYDEMSVMSVKERLQLMEKYEPIIDEETSKLSVEEAKTFMDIMTMFSYAQQGYNSMGLAVDLKTLKLSGNSEQLDNIIQIFLKMVVSAGAIQHCGNGDDLDDLDDDAQQYEEEKKQMQRRMLETLSPEEKQAVDAPKRVVLSLEQLSSCFSHSCDSDDDAQKYEEEEK